MGPRAFPRPFLFASLAVALLALPGRSMAANVAVTFPDGVKTVKGILAATSVGVGPAYAKSAEFQDMAKRLGLASVFLTGENAFASYATRCTSGEFKGVLDAIAKAGMANGHPELANAPIVGVGHSHGGDYWNYFNACIPDRFALLMVKSAGGVQYMGAALRTPMVWEVGTNDLMNSMGHFRADMFAHRPKGQILSLVLGPGESHGGNTPAPRAMVATLVEAIFKLRVPAEADASAGPVTLNVIDETSGQYWLGNNYSREVSAWASSPDKNALYNTSFLPSEEIANKWKTVGANLPMTIKVATGGVCSTCYAHPASEPAGGPSMGGPQPGGAPPPAADAGAAPDPGPVTPDASTTTVGPPPSTPPAPDPGAPSGNPAGKTAGGKVTGGCALGGSPHGGLLLALGAAALLVRRRRR